MAILNEYELHKLAVFNYVGFNETIQNKKEALIAMSILPKEDGYSSAEYANLINKALNEKLDSLYKSPVDTLCVLQQNTMNKLEFNIPAGNEEKDILWEIIGKNGEKISGSVKVSETSTVKDIENNEMKRKIGGVIYERKSFELPQDILDNLEFDYHTLKINIPGQGDVETELAYAPEKCYQSPNLNEKKLRGTSVAISALRSNENLGIGNYTDLAQFSHIMAENNLHMVGTLPIHAMPHRQPESASPYSPTSRTFFNFLYLDVTAIPEFKQSKEVQAIYDSPEFEKKRRRNQDVHKVDYTTSYELLMPILTETYKSFVKNGTKERKEEFEKYKKEKGQSLQNFALFQALTEHFCNQKPQLPDWSDWPKEYQDLDTPEVKAFAEKNKHMTDFFAYLQWETLRQINGVQEACIKAGMDVGIYRDQAVGAKFGSYETWAYKKLYMKGSLGIPPDMCSADGQNWGIVCQNPSEMENTGFKGVREMMEANMLGGMLRIDCPLCSYCVANFIPEGKTAKDCISIHMPTDKMMALTALTSHKTKTLVVFEDLGAIPHHFREKIQKTGGITYKVLPYERGSLRDFPTSSLVVTSTHDSESLNIGWKGAGAYMLENHNCLPPEHVNNYLKGAHEYRQHMTGLLRAEKIADFDENANANVPVGYYKAVAELIGNNEHCNSGYGIMPIGDILGLPHWRENLPGTAELHASKSPNALSAYSGEDNNLPNENWRLKLPFYLNELASNPRLQEVTSALSGVEEKSSTPYTRPGRNEPPRRDSERLWKLYTRLAQKEEERIQSGEKPRFSGSVAYEIWGARFSQKKKGNLSKSAESQKQTYINHKKAIEQKRTEYCKLAMDYAN